MLILGEGIENISRPFLSGISFVNLLGKGSSGDSEDVFNIFIIMPLFCEKLKQKIRTQ